MADETKCEHLMFSRARGEGGRMVKCGLPSNSNAHYLGEGQGVGAHEFVPPVRTADVQEAPDFVEAMWSRYNTLGIGRAELEAAIRADERGRIQTQECPRTCTGTISRIVGMDGTTRILPCTSRWCW